MKRFTETDKWKSPQFLKMKPTEKLVWFYIMDNCDCAGFMEWDADVCAMFTGMKVEHVEGAYEGLIRGFKGAKDSSWIHVPDFLKAQKNLPLNPENNAHKQIISRINDMIGIFPCVAKEYLGASNPLVRGTGKVKDKVKDKVKVPSYTPEFEEWWELFGRKGSKINAMKRWVETADVRPNNLDAITKQYLAHCKATDRTQKDAEGWLNGQMWESDWSANTNKPSNRGQL